MVCSHTTRATPIFLFMQCEHIVMATNYSRKHIHLHVSTIHFSWKPFTASSTLSSNLAARLFPKTFATYRFLSTLCFLSRTHTTHLLTFLLLVHKQHRHLLIMPPEMFRLLL